MTRSLIVLQYSIQSAYHAIEHAAQALLSNLPPAVPNSWGFSFPSLPDPASRPGRGSSFAFPLLLFRYDIIALPMS
jgi:hypothetical protein